MALTIDIPYNGDRFIRRKIENNISKQFNFFIYGSLPGIKSGRPDADYEGKKTVSFIEQNADIYKGLVNLPSGIDIDYKKIIKKISFFYNIGVRRFTINDINLSKRLLTIFPDVKLTLGVYAFLNDDIISDISHFDTVIIPHYFANRNYKLLRHFHSVLKNKASLFLNQICKFGCTEYKEHADFLQKKQKGQNYYFLGCSLFAKENPLIGTFFRPEDVPNLIDMGFTKFKLINRKDTTDAIIYKIHHYTRFKPANDLFKLIRPQVKQQEYRMEKIWNDIHLFNTKTKVHTSLLGKDWFSKTGDCSLNKCNNTCNYCNEIWTQICPH